MSNLAKVKVRDSKKSSRNILSSNTKTMDNNTKTEEIISLGLDDE